MESNLDFVYGGNLKNGIKIKEGEKRLERKKYLRGRSILVTRSFCKLRMSRAILETILR